MVADIDKVKQIHIELVKEQFLTQAIKNSKERGDRATRSTSHYSNGRNGPQTANFHASTAVFWVNTNIDIEAKLQQQITGMTKQVEQKKKELKTK